jgi:lysophospholipase L1-like esterase
MPKDALELYLQELKKFIYIAKTISKKVIIYATPHYEEEFKRLRLNGRMVLKLEAIVKTICKENNVTYLKPDLNQREYFKDIVHFNDKGHIEMTKILYEIINK